MTDSLDDLPFFGHCGRTSYDRDNAYWSAQNDRRRHASIRFIGEKETFVQPSGSQDIETAKSARFKEQESTRLANEVPELGPAQRAVIEGSKNVPYPEDLAESERHLFGDLFGHSSPRDAPLKRSVPVFAFVNGQCKEEILVVKGQAVEQGWADDDSLCLESVRVNEEDALKLKSESGSVFQVFLAQMNDDDRLLLLARYRKTLKISEIGTEKPKSSRSRAWGPWIAQSRLQVNQSLEINIEEIHRHTLVDAQFNSWHPSRLAMIDVSGRWSIWYLKAGKTLQAQLVYDGLYNQMSPIETNVSQANDGWHRILWLLSTKLIIGCRRTGMQLFKADNFSLSAVESPFVLRGRNRLQTLLDIRSLSARNDHIFVTTKSHVHSLVVVPQSPVANDAQRVYRIHRLISVEHYRGHSDLKMHLSMGHDRRNLETSILLFSQDNELITEHSFYHSYDDEEQPTARAKAPRTLNQLSHGHSAIDQAGSGLTSILIRPVSRNVRNRHSTLNQRIGYSGIQLGQALVFTRDLALESRLYCSYRKEFEQNATLKTLDWKRDLLPNPALPRVIGKDFIVDDESGIARDHDGHAFEGWQRLVEPKWWSRHHAGGSSSDRGPLSYELTYEQTTSTASTDYPKMTEVASTLEDTPRSLAQNNNFTPETLMHLLDYNVQLDDVEASHAAFQSILQRGTINVPGSPTPFTISHLELPDDNSMDALYRLIPSLSTMYRFLIENWIGSLPPAVSGATRIVKERTARQIAAMVFLSSLIVRRQPTAGMPQPPSSQIHTQRLPSTAPLPQREPQAIPSQPAPASAPPKQQPEAEEAEPSPLTAAGILSRWNPAADPYEYDPDAQVTDATNLAQTKQHRRLERQVQREEERRRKRQRVGQGKAASQPEIQPANSWASSQFQPEIQTQVSGQQKQDAAEAQAANAVASQILPGAFGGRQGLAVRRKDRERPKRKAGF